MTITSRFVLIHGEQIQIEAETDSDWPATIIVPAIDGFHAGSKPSLDEIAQAYREAARHD